MEGSILVVLFAPILGRSQGSLPSVACLVQHGTEALVHSNHPRVAAASTNLALIFGRIASMLPWFLCSTKVLMQLPHQCRNSVTLGTIQPEESGAGEMPQSFSIKLHSETQVSGHLVMSGGKSPRHAQNPVLSE